MTGVSSKVQRAHMMPGPSRTNSPSASDEAYGPSARRPGFRTRPHASSQKPFLNQGVAATARVVESWHVVCDRSRQRQPARSGCPPGSFLLLTLTIKGPLMKNTILRSAVLGLCLTAAALQAGAQTSPTLQKIAETGTITQIG